MAVIVPGPRVITLGNAPIAQTGAGGQWATAWSQTGVTAVQKADASNAAEAWTAVKYTDLLSTTLAGGDISKGDLGVSGQSAATSSVKQEIDGKEALRFNLAEAAQAVTLNLSSFFAADDGSAYAEGARVRVFDGAGNLVGETFVTANSLDGNQLVQLNSAQAFRSVEISAGARKADGSFSFGAYSNSDGSFGSEIYTAGTKHGSDFLLDGVSFTLARPAATADSYVLDEDAALTNFASVLANDTDPNGTPLSAVLETGPAHGTLTFNADGNFSYQAEANYNGADSFTYRASNGKDFSDATTVNLKINAVNDAPVARNDSASTSEDTVVTGNVLSGSSGGLDTDIDGDALALVTTGAFTTTLGASVTLNANGNYSYDPTGSSVLQAMGEGATRIDGFDYTVSDGHGGTSTAHVAVTVQGREDGAGTVLLPSVEPGTELTYYMRYTASSGASEWVEIDAVTLGMSSGITTGKGGTLLGKAVPDDVVLSLGGGKAVGDLTARLLSGTTVTSVEIEAYAGGGKGKMLVQEYKFTDALVTSAQTGMGADGGTGSTLAFTYRALDQVLTPFGKDGRPATAQEFSWDVPAGDAKIDSNEKVDPGADAVVGDAVTGSDPALEYYIHIDGLAGWIPLNEFNFGYTADSTYLKDGFPTPGKPVASELTLGLGNSEVLTTLLKNELASKGGTIQVEAYGRVGQDGERKLVDEYFFNKAYTTELDSSGDGNTLNVLYNSFTHSHLAYDLNGKTDKTQSTAIGYDFVAHKNLPASGTNAEALDGHLSSSLPPGAELTYYMRYTDNGVSKWMEIDGFTFGVDAPVTALKGVSQTGEPVAQAFTMELGSGKAMTDFNARLLSGTTISNIEIEAYSNGFDGPQLRQEFRFTEALITSVQTSADNGATSNTLGFVYRTVDQAIIPVRDDGKPMTAIKVGWDFQNNTATLPSNAAVDPGADVDTTALAPIDNTSTPLDYYIHIDGVDGWVELSSFMLGYTAESSSTKGSPSAGRPLASEVTLELGLSQALNTLLKNEFTGASTTIQVEAYLPGDKSTTAKLVDEYIFTRAVASEVHSSTYANNDVSLAYAGFTHSHLVYQTNGKLDTANSSSVGFDFGANTKLSVPTAIAEATKAPQQTVPENSDLTYYMRYTDGGTSKWLEIDGFSFGVDAEVGIAKSVGMVVKSLAPETFAVQLGTGKALADFTLNLLTGSDIGTIEIEARTRGFDTELVVQEYKLTKAYVTGVETAAGADGSTGNTLSFTYGTVDHAVSTIGLDGKLTKTVGAGYDFERETTNLPSQAQVDPGPDATPDALAPQFSTGAPLEYYIHVNGVAGWVALSSFSLDYAANTKIVSGSGALIGKATHSALTVELGLNQVLTTLMKNEVAGTAFNVQVEAYSHSGGDERRLVDEYIFSTVYTTGVDSDGGANEVSLTYDAFTHKHLAYDSKGRVDTANSTGVGYDFAHVKVIGVPDASPDLFP
ncbi:type VI secretion system tube protein Hcp [Duganella sp. PWIR1]